MDQFADVESRKIGCRIGTDRTQINMQIIELAKFATILIIFLVGSYFSFFCFVDLTMMFDSFGCRQWLWSLITWHICELAGLSESSALKDATKIPWDGDRLRQNQKNSFVIDQLAVVRVSVCAFVCQSLWMSSLAMAMALIADSVASVS